MFTYVGSELHLFSHAVNWKAYWSTKVSPFIGANVLDVGAGIGATAKLLCSERQSVWLALEPDSSLLGHIQGQIDAGALPKTCTTRLGTLNDVKLDEEFDTILYIDVLEHIEDDAGELARAAGHLRPGGRLIVLCPAHQWLFTPFDKALGHFRRYDKKSMRVIGSKVLRLENMLYLDSCGLLASIANKLLLNSARPTLRQILFWDNVLVRMSRIVDHVFGYRIGKTIIAIWQKP
jgi:SAM-dependent methyltransferase